MMIYEVQIQNLTSGQGQVNTLTLPKLVVQRILVEVGVKKLL